MQRNTLFTALMITGLSSGSAALAEVPELNLNIDNVTVSGLSSGGYMAGQFHMAYSDWVNGAGVIAAGPYPCARNSITTGIR